MISSAHLVVIGGGAAGFFGAIQAKRLHPDWRVCLLEKSQHLLAKVKISGGGRCNVTHACFDPQELTRYYPRGSKELLGPFHQFQPKDTVDWFQKQGIQLKTEADGRMFPVSDCSQTVIDCFLGLAQQMGINIFTQVGVVDIQPQPDGPFHLKLSSGDGMLSDKILMATGGNPSSTGWQIAKRLGHTLVDPVPSLFSFNIQDACLQGLQGLSMPAAQVQIIDAPYQAVGPILITHWGLSGPAILKLSAWAARHLHQLAYQFQIRVDWTGMGAAAVLKELLDLKIKHARRLVSIEGCLGLPTRLAQRLVEQVGLPANLRWADIDKNQLKALVDQLTACPFQVRGKSTNKDEFVTAGGVCLKEVDFKSMQSKIVPHLYFAGEALDMDGITGGFNFQAAWTTSWIAATYM